MIATMTCRAFWRNRNQLCNIRRIRIRHGPRYLNTTPANWHIMQMTGGRHCQTTATIRPVVLYAKEDSNTLSLFIFYRAMAFANVDGFYWTNDVV
jgi:hypothetical protein